jgi:hypothetical protein
MWDNNRGGEREEGEKKGSVGTGENDEEEKESPDLTYEPISHRVAKPCRKLHFHNGERVYITE